MRPERLYLQDIIDCTDAIAGYIATLTREQFIADDLSRGATVYKLIIIGEAAAHISWALSEHLWSDIVGLRNIAVHAYHTLEWNIVWGPYRTIAT